ncbi:hypothetical protein H6F43_04750 [Leptolyngbya sp. FACHB-36]|uniref:hypothetical protein n=1 Tax=Leptolyngbya sp. FACHB-36 TaxID=2692808 RepID=UPI00168110F7|nr:hypothetical protein [Leptolyngbya sp. FACHB-36]MBD2019494.1 hypothetical protein [Leptolyngbya sp. FACHB-36]
MPHLVNYANQQTLLNHLEQAVRETRINGEDCVLYAVTCYFDREAAEKLVACINEALKAVQGRLTQVHIFIDIGDWSKYRGDGKELVSCISRRVGLEKNKIEFIPINFKGRLFHVKSYGLVSSKTQKGFLATTSGNLTRRGLGIHENSNIEIVEITHDSASLSQFIRITKELREDYCASRKLIAEQDDFVLALRILQAGEFYHKWEGNLSSAVRFQLTLTEKGKESQKVNKIFKGYQSDSNSILRDPLNLQQVFSKIPKLFPERFWAAYSVDTLLGRWVPRGIANLVDETLEKDFLPYLKKIEEITSVENLKLKEAEIREEVEIFKKKDYIEGDVDKLVSGWRDRAEKFHSKQELIKLCIYKYEKVPEILDSANRRLVRQTFECLRDQLEIPSRRQGIKASLKIIIESRARNLEEKLEELESKARREFLT